jgi:two-component system sensor kinase FixL
VEEVKRKFLMADRARSLVLIVAMVALIATADWFVGNKASLGVFYILPMVVGASALPTAGIILLAVLCSAFRSTFDIPSPYVEQLLRFIFATLAYASAGLLVATLIRNRELAIAHLANLRHEQELRREAEEQLRILVESSPAAILTVDGAGKVIAANRATDHLFTIPEGDSIRGRQIGGYLPVLADALRFDPGPEGMRTATQCQGRREDGEIFVANTWFSSYLTAAGMRLAAIVVDSSEEMRDREEESFRQMTAANRITAAAVFHEVRNLSSAIGVISLNLRRRYAIIEDENEDFRSLNSLVKGLENIAALELRVRDSQSGVDAEADDTDLQGVLDDLRILIEPAWREIGGTVSWYLPDPGTRVIADRHGLLQCFLNLVYNSHRAVQDAPRRDLVVAAQREDQRAIIRFEDSGPGVAAPEGLFTAFQAGAEGTGLGLYISRAILRSYGGDLRFEPRDSGCCFTVELCAAD